MSNTDTIKTQIAQAICSDFDQVQEWFKSKNKVAECPFYSSIDIRDAQFKIAPVDCNLYPAGFNNICAQDMRAAPKIVRSVLGAEVKKALIIPEKNTKNTFYAENLFYLQQIISDADIDCRVGWYPDEGPAEVPQKLVSNTGKEVLISPISIRDNGRLTAGDFDPDLIILNNDFSNGYPKLLDRVQQSIVPSHKLGWHSRRKGVHFEYYNHLVQEFCDLIKIDPWLMQVGTTTVNEVSFGEERGIEPVVEATQAMIQKIKSDYAKRSIDQEPFVFVKSNMGTYGMGVMVVRNEHDLETMNRRTKNKMSVGKNKIAIESVIVQEGIPTRTVVNRLPAEPVIYLMQDHLIGGFLRTNTQKSAEENLNSNGMVFHKLCMSDLPSLLDSSSQDSQFVVDGQNRLLELVYGSIARLSSLAAGQEIAHPPAR